MKRKKVKGIREFEKRFRALKDRTLVGLTGSAAAGKSSALAYFREAGAFCVSSDALAKELLTSGVCYNKILEKFGPGIFLKNGSLDRSKLAERVFSDKAERKRLENILHPEILRKTLSLIKKSHETIIVAEIPLLFETGLEGCFDFTICVNSSRALRSERAVLRGWTQGEMKARSAAQLPEGTKVKLADIVVENDGSLKELRNTVRRIYDFLNATALEKK